MSKSNLADKRILDMDDGLDVSTIMTERSLGVSSDGQSPKSPFYLQAIALLNSWTYDLAILDFSGIRGRDLSRK